MEDYRYVWFNVETGEFGKSYTRQELDCLDKSHHSVKEWKDACSTTETKWRFIKYKCLTHPEFILPSLDNREN